MTAATRVARATGGGPERRRFLSRATPGATLTRLLLATIIGPPTAFLDMMALGAGSLPQGIAIAVPLIALVWLWLADLVAMIRRRYRERPSYVWWLTACLSFCVLWTVWAVCNPDIHWGSGS